VTYTDADHAAWRARADAAHPDRACLGCRYCDPVPGWSQPEPVLPGIVRTTWIGGTDGQPRP
jgi:hypothetical protein